ncbi:MAG: hypothetical protein KatS3mg103_0806 [Phycisphaerales bacterium]|nr:MAG: hypothetical protein KatS3mg103_0806 [Phycisphaerales bacterium]
MQNHTIQPSASGIGRHAWAVALAVVMVFSGLARAQLEPVRTYCGINREIPVVVTLPEGQAGEPTIVLYTAQGERVAQASVLAGTVDLATFFPILWGQREPRLLYAQLYAGDPRQAASGQADGQATAAPGQAPQAQAVGSPLVLQPMVTPKRAVLVGGRLQWQEGQSVFSGLRVYVDKLLRLETTEGPMVFVLRPDEAPNTVWHIRQLVEGGFYTDIPFHRVVPTHPSGQPFVIQAGDPTGTGSGGPGVFIDLEPSELVHDFGVLSMARTQDPDTNGSQFFIALSKEATVHLNGQYTAFGQAVEGARAILAVEQTPLADVRMGRPANPPRILSAAMVQAPPFGQGREPVRRPSPPAER